KRKVCAGWTPRRSRRAGRRRKNRRGERRGRMKGTEREMTESTLKRTPLDALHVEAGAKMVPFGGWMMPLHYGSQIEEHHAVRRDVGIFDVSHMGQVIIEGPRALELVRR